jgi:hypothetical protein
MKLLEQKLGKAQLDASMQQYYKQWKFKHPQPADFKQSIEQSSNQNLTTTFNRLKSTTLVDTVVQRRTLKPVLFFSLKETNKYNYISIAPILSGNYYDKLSLGLLIHNYQLPINKFNFFVAPQYAIGSKQINLSSGVSFNQFKKILTEISASALKYSMDEFTPVNQNQIFQQVVRINPSIKYTVYNKDLRSNQRWIFQARSFFIQENGLLFTTINTPST